MNFVRTIVVASIAVAVSLDVATAWIGSVTLYKDSNFRGPSCTIEFWGEDSYTCYNLNDFNDVASSAHWRGIPASNAIGGPIHIQFYTDANCRGTMKRWKSTEVHPSNFQTNGINDQISSFVITEIRNSVDDNLVNQSCQ